ncbi:MAG: hypothetical protein QOG68_1142, partial [Solirubrobacteraceae bacterium]|nr:hypothetical protein [Solirubrobacteraceae bacterium]
MAVTATRLGGDRRRGGAYRSSMVRTPEMSRRELLVRGGA